MSLVSGVHHLRLPIPRDGEERARGFWRDVLVFDEVPLPGRPAPDGGCCFRTGRVEVRLAVEEPFSPATTTWPALVVDDLDAAAAALARAGLPRRRDDRLPGLDRVRTTDPFGSRVALVARRPADVVVRWAVPADEADVRAAVVELAAEDFDFALGLGPDDDFGAWCRRVRAQARGAQLAPGLVPATGLVGTLDGRVVGRVHVRHELTPFLRDVGGHIGYGVRPAWRGRGVGGALLEAGLGVAARHGIDEALVTCDDGNRASARVIERAGGRLVGVTLDEDAGLHKRRYLVPTASGRA